MCIRVSSGHYGHARDSCRYILVSEIFTILFIKSEMQCIYLNNEYVFFPSFMCSSSVKWEDCPLPLKTMLCFDKYHQVQILFWESDVITPSTSAQPAD